MGIFFSLDAIPDNQKTHWRSHFQEYAYFYQEHPCSATVSPNLWKSLAISYQQKADDITKEE